VSGGLEITLELAEGMGHGNTARAGSVPAVGDRVCYSNLTDDHKQRGTYPAPKDTPWTHGGPPAQQPDSSSDDANEEWS
jgi:hypothetical protein